MDEDTKPLYGGTCCPMRTGYRVVFCQNKKRIHTSFSVRKYGSREKARIAAEAFQREESDRRGQTKIRVIPKYTLGPVPIHVRQYVAGIFDGDGCVSIFYRKEGRYQASVSINQSQEIGVPTVLTFIQQYYGGSITDTTREMKNVRPSHRLEILVEHRENFLKDIRDYSILKAEQARLMLEYPTSNNRKLLCDTITRLKDEYHLVSIDKSKITTSYIAGFFDAQGSVDLSANNSLRASIAHTQCPTLLFTLKELLGNAVKNSINKEWYTYSGETIEFLQRIREFSIVKQAQIDCILEYKMITPHKFLGGNKKRPRELQENLDNARAEMKKLKKI